MGLSDSTVYSLKFSLHTSFRVGILQAYLIMFSLLLKALWLTERLPFLLTWYLRSSSIRTLSTQYPILYFLSDSMSISFPTPVSYLFFPKCVLDLDISLFFFLLLSLSGILFHLIFVCYDPFQIFWSEMLSIY